MAPPSTKTLATLLGRASLDDHEEVLAAANASLRASKDDIKAQHVKVVALIKLDRYEEALQTLERGSDGLKQHAALEHCYVLYKLGRWADAESLAKEHPTGRGPQHIEAQAAYRLEEFEHAAQLYQDLSNQPAQVQNEDVDLRINTTATGAQLAWVVDTARQGLTPKLARADLEAFETTYNAACINIARGELARAEVLLRRATDLCNALDWPDEDKRMEVLPIAAQRLYVLLKLGKVGEAEILCKDLTIEEISDLGTRWIAQNNVLACSPSKHNPYLAHRLFHSRSLLQQNDSPFKYQDSRLQHNAAVLDLLQLKYTAVANSSSRKLSQLGPSTSASVNQISVLNAAAHARSRSGRACLNALLPLSELRPHHVGLLATIVQQCAAAKSYDAAANLLRSSLSSLESEADVGASEVRFAPGLIGLFVSLHQRQGRTREARAELKKAAVYWQNKQQHPSLLRAGGAELLHSGKADDLGAATRIFEGLRDRDPNDRAALAGIVALRAFESGENEPPEEQQLSPISSLTAGIDVDVLEQAGIPRAPAPASRSRKRKEAEHAEKPAKKRSRKSRLPKNYDPSKPPDPERWLPLRDRSTFKPKNKRGKAKAAAHTQGGIAPSQAEMSSQRAGIGPGGKTDNAGSATALKSKKKKGRVGR